MNIIRGRYLQKELLIHSLNKIRRLTIYHPPPPTHLYPNPPSASAFITALSQPQKDPVVPTFQPFPPFFLLLTYSHGKKERKDKEYLRLNYLSGSLLLSLISFFNRNWLLRGGFYGYFGTLLTVTRGMNEKRVRGRGVGDVLARTCSGGWTVLYCRWWR